MPPKKRNYAAFPSLHQDCSVVCMSHSGRLSHHDWHTRQEENGTGTAAQRNRGVEKRKKGHGGEESGFSGASDVGNMDESGDRFGDESSSASFETYRSEDYVEEEKEEDGEGLRVPHIIPRLDQASNKFLTFTGPCARVAELHTETQEAGRNAFLIIS